MSFDHSHTHVRCPVDVHARVGEEEAHDRCVAFVGCHEERSFATLQCGKKSTGCEVSAFIMDAGVDAYASNTPICTHVRGLINPQARNGKKESHDLCMASIGCDSQQGSATL